MTGSLRSPLSGRVLTGDTSHSLSDGADERWPVIDGIAYLRTGRDRLVAEVLRHLDAGDCELALGALLVEQDDWWTGPAADAELVATLVRDRETLSFREAMDHLGFGRVGSYFAHRWSDPTYLAGLALIEAHWGGPSDVFELACGTGAYLRELSRRGLRCTGGDVVFAKLWLARHWIVGPEVELICFDAGSPWPIAGRRHDLVLCHDAFYFLEPKATIAERLQAATAPGGKLAVAHVHNSGYANLSSGAAMTAGALAALFPDATFYDDAELTRALAEARAPRSGSAETLDAVEAFSMVLGGEAPVRSLVAGVALPPAGATLRLNPLYDEDGHVALPSERYREEYSTRATYPSITSAVAGTTPPSEAGARSREFVDLPERW